MAPRGGTLPKAATESAREARKSFFCELCQKGYSRMNDFEAHEGSYDHQHRKRLKDMKQLTRDTNAASRAREKEKDDSVMKSINMPLSTAPKNKPVFTSAFITKEPPKAAQAPPAASTEDVQTGDIKQTGVANNADSTQSNEGKGKGKRGRGDEPYDPRYVTGCSADCPACHGAVKRIDITVPPPGGAMYEQPDGSLGYTAPSTL